MRKGKQSTGAPAAMAAPDVVASCQRCRRALFFSRSATFSPKPSSSKDEKHPDNLQAVSWIPAGLQKQLPQEGDDFLMSLYQFFEYAAETVGHDQPQCYECSQEVLHKQLMKKEAQALLNCTAFAQYLHSLEEQIQEEEDDLEDTLKAELLALEEEEAKAEKKLRKYTEHWNQIQDDQAELKLQETKLDGEIEEWQREYNKCKMENFYVTETCAALDQQCLTETEELNRLNNASIYNEAFHIWFDGHFGTINNFRLGRLRSQTVDPSEMNAAWGHAALLLHTIQRVRNIRWTKFQVLPCGSSPVVNPIEGGGSKTTFELYTGAQGVFFAQKKFDKAMIGFLTCLDEIIQQEMARFRALPIANDQSMKVPYPIEGDKVGGLTIKLASVSHSFSQPRTNCE
eukprot:TRINITY_DN62905_c0_g1_i2.p1 TRINITY_DN62905_c0_g1~~TRINITY_DN62905_c0_g1_i2.p1  ORF type:complete len:399 (+),score=48.15 TRINITY_DN62905_c0_g1_i2:113-1309(+)